MEGGALFAPGFLGGQFLWWIGQIPDDATWRENINPGVYPGKDDQSGWGRRYKVRIIGIHDKDEETIPSDQLPWANVMYPITAGSGQASAYQTPQIRQGNFVFGFFMDGADQQVPVIMGILGNNPQTPLSTSTGTSKDNFSGTSGYARSQDPARVQGRAFPGDDDLITQKPKTPEQQQECAEIPPGLILNKYGLRPDRPLSSQNQKDAASAKAAGESEGLTGRDLEERIKEGVLAGKAARCKQANSPLAQAEPGATIESSATAPHLMPASSVVRDDLYKTKTVLLKPDQLVESAQKGIQTELDNLAEKTKRHLESMKDYTAAVSNKIPDMEPELLKTSRAQAAFDKISVNKMAEYTLKSMMASAAPTIATMPGANRFQYADVQKGFIEKLQEEYLEITNGLQDSVLAVLKDTLKLEEKEQEAMQAAMSLPKDDKDTYADVAICTSEEMVAKTMAMSRPKIDQANNNMMDKMNMFLEDMSSQLAGLTDSLGDMKNKLPNIEGSVTSALQFENMTPNMFPFEMPPIPAVSDFYTMAEGSGAQPDSATPSPMAIGEMASTLTPDVSLPKKIPFAEPSKDQGMVDLVKNKVIDKAKDVASTATQQALDAAGDVSDALDMY